MKLKLVLWDDQSEYEYTNTESSLWIMEINGKEVGGVNTLAKLHEQLDVVLDMEAKDIILPFNE